MPDSSDSILTRLRESVPTKGLEDPWIRLADAEAAVRDTRDATVKEIVDVLRGENTQAVICNARMAYYHHAGLGVAQPYSSEDEAVAYAVAEVARRFPNGGTHDGS